MSQYIRVSKNYGFISKGIIYPLQSKVWIETIDLIFRACRKQDGLVIKPVDGAQGRGVTILKPKGNEIFMNNKKNL